VPSARRSLHQPECFPRNQTLLVGGNDVDGNPGAIGRDPGAVPAIQFGVESQPGPLEPSTDTPPDLRRILPMPPVNTTASAPSKTAKYAPTYFRIR